MPVKEGVVLPEEIKAGLITLIHREMTEFYSGPTPPASDMKILAEIDQTFPERVLVMSEKQQNQGLEEASAEQKHRHDLEIREMALAEAELEIQKEQSERFHQFRTEGRKDALWSISIICVTTVALAAFEADWAAGIMAGILGGASI